VNFDIIRTIPKDYCRTKFSLKLSWDHSSVIFTVNSKIIIESKLYTLCNAITKWLYFRLQKTILDNLFFCSTYFFQSRFCLCDSARHFWILLCFIIWVCLSRCCCSVCGVGILEKSLCYTLAFINPLTSEDIRYKHSVYLRLTIDC